VFGSIAFKLLTLIDLRIGSMCYINSLRNIQQPSHGRSKLAFDAASSNVLFVNDSSNVRTNDSTRS
jgi:hypothetical protein